jgi:hypothetical protein
MARVFREKKSYGTLKGLLFIAAVVAVIVLILVMTSSVDDSRRNENIKIDKEAIVRATVQCYSIEGRYPSNIEYLEENYGLTLDRSKYIYHYNSIGENMMPIIELFPSGG